MPEQYDTAAEAIKAQSDAANKAAIDARESDPPKPETEEEYYARIEEVRATGIFGDTPTDPTIGDVVVPTSDEETAGVNVAKVDAAAEDGDEEAQDASPEEAKRQTDAPSQEDQDAATVAAAEDEAKDESEPTPEQEAAQERQDEAEKEEPAVV